MNEKKLTNKEKVEKLKQNSKRALDEKRKQILESPSPILEKGKGNKRRISKKQDKNSVFSFQKKFASFSTSFTEKDLLLQVCIVVPPVLLLLLICKQVLLYR